MKKTLIKITAIVLALTLAIIPAVLSASASVYYLISGISYISANTSSTTDKYGSHWQYWCQGASKYSAMREAGCRLVAQAKLLVECGAAPASESLFNPDDYFEWGRDKGYFGSGTGELLSNGEAAVKYASAKGSDLKLVGTVSLSGKTRSEAADTAYSYIKKGYYVIVGGTNTSANMPHQQYVGRAASLGAGEAVILDSFVNSSQNSNSVYTMAAGRSDLSMSYSTLLYFSCSGGLEADIEFSFPTDSKYSSKYSVDAEKAYLVNKVVRTDGGYVTSAGMILYDADKNEMASISEDTSNFGSVFHMWYDTKDDLKKTLTPETKYYYRFTAKADGKDFISDWYDFTTPAKKGYTVTFDPRGGTLDFTKNKIVLEGSAYGVLPEAVREGYSFMGWYDKENAGTKITPETKFTATSDVTLYAHWALAYDGSRRISVKSMPNKTSYLPGETLDTTGMSINYYKEDGTVESIQGGFTCDPTVLGTGGTQKITVTYEGLTCSFTVSVKAESYTVAFNANGGSGAPATLIKENGKNLTLPKTVPVRDGYIFLGWSVNASDDFAQYIAGGVYGADDSAVLYAIWMKDSGDLTCGFCGKPFDSEAELHTHFVQCDMKPQGNASVRILTPKVTTVNYGDIIMLHAVTEGMPEGTKIVWSIEGSGMEIIEENIACGMHQNCTVCKAVSTGAGSAVVTARVAGSTGSEYSSKLTLTSKSGFFQKLISFFKNLFKMSRVIAQAFVD